ncbi:hypothetical protein SERLA73DRAFT_139695 [Serpula lacrymans var. lacrymans S7.3]|uniref:Uncharacterized protein n=2 Tax=Serpula lacrymans var. lacrymans TaxID=341189 RepID=F8Q2Q4_SERL3|nr:uncharacterized protein SERLADRAFT_371311 [Serpula lacrymans var. lacrymans S7.9]EGN97465.1 hypothetical protein SERLA73DRAFT_139695 [Serpula lacrymans var. lacrymans S7.3]EGO23058.1 hypothetical protein SERLADRAFT_371311 [Serpula lacrymans var. lacrymans S7.9]
MQLDFKIRELKKISSRSDNPTYDLAQSLDQVVKSLQALSDGLLEEACSRDADPMEVVQDMTRRRRRGENGDLEDDSHRKRMKGDDDDFCA